MSRYAAMFERLAAAKERAFGAFLMLGDPDLVRSAELLDAVAEGGADMVEVGIPFSDPVADGPVIQAAAKRALDAGVRTRDCLELISSFRMRHPDIPIGILTYANIVVARGVERFCGELAEAGADSLLIADVPCLEAPPFAEVMIAAGIDPVLIAAPNTAEATLAKVARMARGYTYCVARLGVTGAGEQPRLGHGRLFEALRRHGAPPPILGFGISTPGHVRAGLAAGAAGVICGSAIVERAAGPDAIHTVREFVRSMKAATALHSVEPHARHP